MKPQDTDQDEALRHLFNERERRDEAASPSYERVVRRPARAAGERRWVPATVGFLLLALVALGITWRHHQSALSPERPTLATWKAPTDFLLAVPGGELLDSTPSFPDPNLPVSPGRG